MKWIAWVMLMVIVLSGCGQQAKTDTNGSTSKLDKNRVVLEDTLTDNNEFFTK
jgi:hypothetical protein